MSKNLEAPDYNRVNDYSLRRINKIMSRFLTQKNASCVFICSIDIAISYVCKTYHLVHNNECPEWKEKQFWSERRA